jgi:hypothetical protein
MTPTRARSATLVLVTIATLLAVAGLSWILRVPAPALADSIPVTVPDVGSAPDPIFELADSIPVTVPDVGAAPGTGFGGSGLELADSIPVTVPDVGAAPVPSLLVADSVPVTVPDVG